MESSTVMQSLPCYKKLRAGQKETLKDFSDLDYMSVRLPTGYGKTITAMAAFALKQRQSRATHLLFIVPSDAQKEQLVKDGGSDMCFAGVNTSGKWANKVFDLGYFGDLASTKAMKEGCQVFATTIQGLSNGRVGNILQHIMSKGRWMVVLDECHHYGEEKCWYSAVAALRGVTCRLAMSATPFRPKGDEAVGSPAVTVTYEKAVEENAVKPLEGHAYKYRAQFVNEETKDLVTWTTGELEEELGSKPNSAERRRQARKLRWSKQYASPLITQPLFRLQEERLRTGLPLQALIGTLCVSHAEMVCDLIRELCPELDVDWVGTGPDGKSNEENRAVLNRFCPPKGPDGRRHPKLDVLVHVGMAGEGVDCLYVTEVVFLRAVNITNSDLQMIGRGARRSADMPNGLVCHVSFDSDTALKDYTGPNIVRAIDGLGPIELEDPQTVGEVQNSVDKLPPIPDEPWSLHSADLLTIDKGDAAVLEVVKSIKKLGNIPGSAEDLLETFWASENSREKIVNLAREALRGPGQTAFDERAECEQVRKDTERLRTILVGRVLPKHTSVRNRAAADIKTLVNKRACKALGSGGKGAGLDTLKAHYRYWKELIEQVDRGEAPSWLVG